MQDAIDKSDELVEPHPLWEYPCRCASEPFQLMTLDMTRALTEQSADSCGSVPLASGGDYLCNAVALWVEWQLDSQTTVSGGPVASVRLGHQVQWDMHSKQAVYFVKKSTGNSVAGVTLHYRASLGADTAGFHFDFSLQ